jgi:hypothetical protein
MIATNTYFHYLVCFKFDFMVIVRKFFGHIETVCIWQTDKPRLFEELCQMYYFNIKDSIKLNLSSS